MTTIADITPVAHPLSVLAVVPGEAARVEGFAVAGPRYVLAGTAAAPTWFIVRCTERGRPWLRFLARSSSVGGYHVSAYKTLGRAKVL
jgi:hypothetical protein